MKVTWAGFRKEWKVGGGGSETGCTEDLQRRGGHRVSQEKTGGHWDPMGAEEEDTELGEMGVTETLFERHDGRWSCWYMPFNTALRWQ